MRRASRCPEGYWSEVANTRAQITRLLAEHGLGPKIVRLFKERWRAERRYEDLTGELGLDHFEGRSLPDGTIARRRSSRGARVRT
ncbi:MAG: hypothetical protein L6Q84_08170 [Polyangiaceae bacterium]|nr:hypothetical protein [Polyangiaceae bacterium]